MTRQAALPANVAALSEEGLHQAPVLQAAAVFAYILFFGGLTEILARLAGDAGVADDRVSGNPYFQLLSFVLGAIAIADLVCRKPKANLFLRYAWPLVGLTVFALASTAWSILPDVTVRRAIAMALSFAFAMLLARNFTFRQHLRVAAIAVLAVMAIDLIAIALPGFGITANGPNAGSWRGMSGHKNALGRYAGLGILVLFFAARERVISRLSAAGGIVIGLAMLVMSDSHSAWLALAAALATYLAMAVASKPLTVGRARLRPGVIAPIVAIVVLVIVLIASAGAAAILDAMGRDFTFSSRTKIWDYAIAIGNQHALLGSGYRAFWNDTVAATFAATFAHWQNGATLGNGHNGLLDIWLELGWVGVGLFVVFVLSYIASAVWAVRAGFRDEFLWAMTCLAFFLASNMAEKSALERADAMWIMLQVAYLHVALLRWLHGIAERAAAGARVKAYGRRAPLPAWRPAMAASAAPERGV